MSACAIIGSVVGEPEGVADGLAVGALFKREGINKDGPEKAGGGVRVGGVKVGPVGGGEDTAAVCRVERKRGRWGASTARPAAIIKAIAAFCDSDSRASFACGKVEAQRERTKGSLPP